MPSVTPLPYIITLISNKAMFPYIIVGYAYA